jgi:hypothetical protein
LNPIIAQIRNDYSAQTVFRDASGPDELSHLRTLAAKYFAAALSVAALNPVIFVVGNEQTPLTVDEYANRQVEPPGLRFSESTEAADEFDFDLGLGEREGGPRQVKCNYRYGNRYNPVWFFRHDAALLNFLL